jgi:hypothetical protein
LEERYDRGLAWCLESCRVNANRGSSAWQSRWLHPIRGWSHAYPETTGYLIPSLYDALTWRTARATQIRTLIAGLVDWLLSLQMDNGAFPGGHVADDGRWYLTTLDYLRRSPGPPRPSIFNSAQILRGLVRHVAATGDPRSLAAVRRCCGYLAGMVGPDGRWGKDAYAGGTSPAYFAYAAAPIIAAATLVEDEAARRAAVRTLDRVLAQTDATTAFPAGMGFQARSFAHTHTVAYTLQGLLEAGDHLGRAGDQFTGQALRSLDRILLIAERRKRLPGGFDHGWRGEWNYACLTGDCQMALCFLTAHERTVDARYLNAACRLYSGVARSQRLDGAIPGSRPIWGRYMRFRRPNWAVKYFLDLSLGLHARLNAEWNAC